MKLDLDALRILDAVIAQGSFARAAASLNRTQAAISYKLKKLEEQLDVPIFDRNSYRAELTPAGAVILDEARRLLHYSQRLGSIAQSLNEGWEAYIEVVIDGAVPMDPVMRTLKLMADRKVPTRIQMKVEFFAGVQAYFEAQDAHIMIARDYIASPFHLVEPLNEIRFALCAAREHPLATAGRVGLLELQEHVELAINDSRGREDRSASATADGPRVFYLSDFNSKKRAILLGLGFGWLPLYLAQKEIGEGRLAIVDYDNGSFYGFRPKFVTRSVRHFGKAARLFRETLLSYIADGWHDGAEV
jgi:DNA-binding transcriptional LysR family regulator